MESLPPSSATLFVLAGALIAACDRDRPPSTPTPSTLETPIAATVGPSPEDLAKQSAPSGEGLITPWLEVKGNRIRLPDGKPFHGRGVNIHDTRSCLSLIHI